MRNIFELKDLQGTDVPKEIYGYRPYLFAFCASWVSQLSRIKLTYDSAFIGGTLTLPSFKAQFGLTDANSRQTAALSSNIKFGRKKSMIAATLVSIVGAVLQIIGRLKLLYAGRALPGWGIGVNTLVLPIYVSECSPRLIRGRLVGINYGVNQNIPGSDPRQWHIPMAIQFVLAGVLILSLLPMIESPRWLASKGKSQDASKALAWIRNLPNWGVRNCVVLGCGLVTLQNFAGINAINYYSPTIFKSIGVTGTSAGLLGTGVFGIIKMVATFFYAGFFVDKLGRRALLIAGGLGALVPMFYLAIYTKVSGSFIAVPPQDSGARAAIAMIYIYAFFYGLSWNGVPWLFTSEIMPTRVRTLGVAFCICIQWLTQFVVVYSLPYMILGIPSGTFFLFAAFIVLAIMFASLEDMDLLFGSDVSVLAQNARPNYEEAINARVTAFHTKENLEVV
ncbi:general substrate transporter [Xylaria venustula]|nr:general substrate transporter [Xylaria venustula]